MRARSRSVDGRAELVELVAAGAARAASTIARSARSFSARRSSRRRRRPGRRRERPAGSAAPGSAGAASRSVVERATADRSRRLGGPAVLHGHPRLSVAHRRHPPSSRRSAARRRVPVTGPSCRRSRRPRTPPRARGPMPERPGRLAPSAMHRSRRRRCKRHRDDHPASRRSRRSPTYPPVRPGGRRPPRPCRPLDDATSACPGAIGRQVELADASAVAMAALDVAPAGDRGGGGLGGVQPRLVGTDARRRGGRQTPPSTSMTLFSRPTQDERARRPTSGTTPARSARSTACDETARLRMTPSQTRPDCPARPPNADLLIFDYERQ